MPPSTPNLQGSLSPADIIHGAYDSFGWQSFEEWGGSKSVLFRGADGKTVITAAKETGAQTLTYPCNEFLWSRMDGLNSRFTEARSSH